MQYLLFKTVFLYYSASSYLPPTLLLQSWLQSPFCHNVYASLFSTLSRPTNTITRGHRVCKQQAHVDLGRQKGTMRAIAEATSEELILIKIKNCCISKRLKVTFAKNDDNLNLIRIIYKSALVCI